MIEPLVSLPNADWLRLRLALWPDCPADEHLEEMAGFLADPDTFVQFIAHGDDGAAAGFIEAAVRRDYVNGTETSPVLFLEGLYVAPDQRRRGVARALVACVADWGRSRGISELASDAPLDNEVSHALHGALGFEETERVVYFRKVLGDAPGT